MGLERCLVPGRWSGNSMVLVSVVILVALLITSVRSAKLDLSEVDSLNDNDHKDTKSVEMSPLAAHVLNWKRGVNLGRKMCQMDPRNCPSFIGDDTFGLQQRAVWRRDGGHSSLSIVDLLRSLNSDQRKQVINFLQKPDTYL